MVLENVPLDLLAARRISCWPGPASWWREIITGSAKDPLSPLAGPERWLKEIW